MKLDQKLLNLSEVELIKLYREETNQRKRDKIFNVIFFGKNNGGKNWHQYIRGHAIQNKYRSDYYDSGFDVDDLYQEIVQAFMKVLDKWFDLKSKFGFSTYVWYAINSAVDRVFQSSKTCKRYISKGSQLEINQQIWNENIKVSDVVAREPFGNFRAIEKESGIEQIFFCKDLLNYLKEAFIQEEVEVSENLKNELLTFIRDKTVSPKILENLVTKYDMSEDEMMILKYKLSKNLEKQMFVDIIKFIEKDVKDDEALATKYNCSRSQITKYRQKLIEVFKKKMKTADLSLSEFF